MPAGVDSEAVWEDGTVPLSRSEFAPWLRRRLQERTPTAVVRFGDAEARLLMLDRSDGAAMEHVIHKLRRETGLTLSPADALELKRLVTVAYDEADVLGIRFVEAFLPEHRSWMETLFETYAQRMAAGGRRRPATLAHCLLSHDLAGELPSLLKGRQVSVVSCRDLKRVLESEWGLSDVAIHQVPSQFAMRDVDGAYEAAMHDIPIWPDAHARVARELKVRERGEVFLVGAGLFGKDLCIRVRELGGIALDMGSALDSIAGKITRGPERRVVELHSRGMSEAEIAAHLQRMYPVEVSEEMVADALGRHLGDQAAG